MPTSKSDANYGRLCRLNNYDCLWMRFEQSHGRGSWLVCEVALAFGLKIGPNPEDWFLKQGGIFS